MHDVHSCFVLRDSLRQVALEVRGTVLMRVHLPHERFSVRTERNVEKATYDFAIEGPELCGNNLEEVLEHVLLLDSL